MAATPSCPGGTARPIVSDNVRTYRLDPNLGVLISSIGMRQMPAPSSRVTEIEQCSPINSGRFTHGACELYGFDLSSGFILEIMDTVVRNETGIDQLEIVQGITMGMQARCHLESYLRGCAPHRPVRPDSGVSDWRDSCDALGSGRRGLFQRAKTDH